MSTATHSRPDRGACLTITDAAEFLALSPKSVRRLIAQGRLEAFYLTPRALRVRRGDLEAFLAATSTARFGGATA